MGSMSKLKPFAQKVLDYMEPDPERQKIWTEETELAKVSAAEPMKRFRERIIQARKNGEKVIVCGDYDCDGVMATSILVDGLRSLGLETGFYIPDRIREGYGLKKKTVQKAAEKGYSLLITADNGVMADEALKEADRLGLDVILSDHHMIPEGKEFDALCVIHPDVLEAPFRDMCGAGLAFEMMRVLGVNKKEYLQWAAVATIADCVPVLYENRALITSGLKSINEGCELHLSCLAEKGNMNETDIAFQIVPKINCVGRLSNMASVNSLVRYFLSPNARAAGSYAAQVIELNKRRKQMSAQITEVARARIRLSHPVLLACDESFHEGIIGLAAGALCSQYRKPVIVACWNPNGCKASMRAPEGFNCMEFLSGFDQFETCGGHRLAAGFTVPASAWNDFEKYVFRQGLKTEWTPEQKLEIPVTEEEITVENIESLQALRPFGTGFEKPVFVLENPKIVSVFDLTNGKHRKFSLKGGASAMNFNQTSEDMKSSVLSIEKMKGSLEVNVYQGRKSPTFIIDEIVYH